MKRKYQIISPADRRLGSPGDDDVVYFGLV